MGQYRCIVDAITHHAYDPPSRLQRRNACKLGLWRFTPRCIRDAQLPSNGLGNQRVISG